MGIFVAGKNGDAMGGYAFGRFSKKARNEFRINKEIEEERDLAVEENFYKRQRVVQKCEEVRRKQLRDLKHYGK